MMKKIVLFLVLLMVFGLASAANAAVTAGVQIGGSPVTQVNPGDTVDVIIGNDVPAAGGTIDFAMNATHAENGIAALLDPWALPPSPPAVITADGTGGLDFAFGNGTIGFNVTGDWLQATFDIPSGTLGETLTLSFTGGMFGAAPPTTALSIVPEPTTIALLGIGGLFLLRRRK